MTYRLDPAYFEGLYADAEDPWGFATSPYEREKYERTLAACGPGPIGRALEVGCSIGVFTAVLAPRCAELLAVDCSEAAVARARARLGNAPGARIERRTLPEEAPRGPFDLIVCSEVLYYWSRPLLLGALATLGRALAPGGGLVAVHWTPRTSTYPLQGDEVHGIVAEALADHEHVRHERHPRYVLDRWDRPRG